MTIRHDGKVGIGTSSPSEALHVIGNIKSTGMITVDKPDEHCFIPFLNDDRFYFANQTIVDDIKQASYPKEPYVSFLDHILVSQNLITNQVLTLPIDQWMNGYDVYETYISDHKPVFLSFKIE